MSAAAARRRKQLLARKKEAEATNLDPVSARLQQLLEGQDLKEEATAYEALQLAQSQVRKKVSAGEFSAAVDLAYESAFKILSNGRVSVASQLLTLLATVLRETHTEESDAILQHCQELHKAFCTAMEGKTGEEATRLHRLHRDWLRRLVQWSSELGPVRFGHCTLQELLAQQSWALTKIVPPPSAASALEDEDELMELKTDAVTHMALAEQPDQILAFLKELPAPTAAQTKAGHVCPPSDRDALLTRAVLCFVAVENLRDASKLVRAFIEQVEDRDIGGLTKSYTSKDDGKAPSHVIFCSMLIRICEKDPRTGPLFSWLLRSFKKELDGLYKHQIIQGYTTKIGKAYFNIQPPPNMLNMLENMMGMMGGAGGPGGMNPAMMQAMMANMK
eukprot:Nitzschia sp. Nitz4//scaffold9_size221794//134116//135285//NITZ4_001363-RA/size221794-processed-gene-0.335-mRNA-1//-1//CDS//3329561052//200//frame0